jgi:imidazolonepropionase-like amidohydrolase
MSRSHIGLLMLCVISCAGSAAHAHAVPDSDLRCTAWGAAIETVNRQPSTVSHQYDDDDDEDTRTADPPGEPEPEKPKADDKDDDRYLAIIGGTVHTVSGPVLRNARILTKNGKIKEIGPNVMIPDNAEVIDANGHHVYPGLVAVRSFGLFGSGSAEDSTNVYSLNMTTALAGGITTAVSGSNVYKLLIGELADMVVSENVFVSLNYSTSNPEQRRRLRASLDRLRQHHRDVEAYQRASARGEEGLTEPDARWIRGRNAELNRLLKGEAVALSSANSSHDLLQLAELAQQYGISIVANGAHEGWVVPAELSRAGMQAIITPRRRVDRNEQLNRPNGSSIENAVILHRHGVRFAIIPASPGISFGGLGGRDLLHLRMEAAFAVRGGLSNRNAVRAITIEPARILGVDHRVGSIDIGKDADFVITDGDILHYMTHARWTIVNGKVMYDKQKESLFDHIRPDGDMDAPPPDDHWPRRLGEPF